jgi:sulfatase modifying factor 1
MVHVADYGFHIDKYEVTNAQYAVFLNLKGNQSEGGVTWLEDDSEYVLIERGSGRFTPKSGLC